MKNRSKIVRQYKTMLDWITVKNKVSKIRLWFHIIDTGVAKRIYKKFYIHNIPPRSITTTLSDVVYLSAIAIKIMKKRSPKALYRALYSVIKRKRVMDKPGTFGALEEKKYCRYGLGIKAKRIYNCFLKDNEDYLLDSLLDFLAYYMAYYNVIHNILERR